MALEFPNTHTLSHSFSNHRNPQTMLLLSPTPAQLIPPSRRRRSRSAAAAAAKTRIPAPSRVLSMAKDTSDPDSDVGLAGKAAIAGGLVSTPVIAWSLYTLKTTGCGLPPGPGGSIGALEGVSYLAVLGIVGWSAYTKSKTGSGLPSGPFGLLGAVEGLSYLALLGIAVVFALQFFEKGYIPGPLPADQCFG